MHTACGKISDFWGTNPSSFDASEALTIANGGSYQYLNFQRMPVLCSLSYHTTCSYSNFLLAGLVEVTAGKGNHQTEFDASEGRHLIWTELFQRERTYHLIPNPGTKGRFYHPAVLGPLAERGCCVGKLQGLI